MRRGPRTTTRCRNQEEAEEAHAFERQSEEGSMILSYGFVRQIPNGKRAWVSNLMVLSKPTVAGHQRPWRSPPLNAELLGCHGQLVLDCRKQACAH